ncbi:MAG TPA: luciferase family protein [Candidatus Bathyarchaeia archaeon]
MEDESSTYESLRAWILQLPGIREAPHRVGGVEFQVDGVEFMHSHGPSWLDIRLSKEDQTSVLKAGLALSHKAEVHAQAGWVSFRIENRRDLVNAKKVIQLAYENAKKTLI